MKIKTNVQGLLYEYTDAEFRKMIAEAVYRHLAAGKSLDVTKSAILGDYKVEPTAENQQLVFAVVDDLSRQFRMPPDGTPS